MENVTEGMDNPNSHIKFKIKYSQRRHFFAWIKKKPPRVRHSLRGWGWEIVNADHSIFNGHIKYEIPQCSMSSIFLERGNYGNISTVSGLPKQAECKKQILQMWQRHGQGKEKSKGEILDCLQDARRKATNRICWIIWRAERIFYWGCTYSRKQKENPKKRKPTPWC